MVDEIIYLVDPFTSKGDITLIVRNAKRRAVRSILRLGKTHGPTDASLSSFGPNAHRMSLQISATSTARQ